jgi:hypothetical protein
MSVALCGLGLPHWVVVHDVAGLAPGRVSLAQPRGSGVPRYPNVPAGPPGAPSRVRRVTPAP